MATDIKTFFQVQIRRVPQELEDEVTFACIDGGAEGVSQDLQFRQQDEVYTPEIVSTSHVDLNAFFNVAPSTTLLREIAEIAPTAVVEVLERPQEDWMEGWKKHFKAFPLIGDYWIVPSWLETPAEAKVSIRIDPGMAFGTGTHATTQLASGFLVSLRTGFIGKRVLDVGTGTGVLAILAAHLGAAEVEATEIDPIAREVAIENVELNRIGCIRVLDHQIEQIDRPYDLVVANIIDGVLVRLKQDLMRLMKPEGRMILTGILEERREEFLVRFLADTDLEIEAAAQKDEWWGFVVRRRSP